ncbi:alpha/beta hydrolase [Myxococcota bacterium]|nr:alpha/beta hydrolase [Myxococcota bacterium]
MEPHSRRIRAAHGLELHLLEWSTEGVPMLLLHGFGNEAHLWDDFAPKVAPHYRVLALDQRGHGDSDHDPESRYDVHSMVEDVEALTRALDIDRLVIIGFSMGGRVATLFAGRHPERMAGLVIVDIGPEVDPRGTTRIRGEIEEDRSPRFASIEEYAAQLSLHYPAGQRDALLRMARYGLKPCNDGMFELKIDPALRGVGVTADDPTQAAEHEQAQSREMWDALARIPCPTLVIRGAASDILSPEVADRMVDEVLQNGQLAIVPQAAHSVATDNPAEFTQAVCDFVLA